LSDTGPKTCENNSLRGVRYYNFTGNNLLFGIKYLEVFLVDSSTNQIIFNCITNAKLDNNHDEYFEILIPSNYTEEMIVYLNAVYDLSGDSDNKFESIESNRINIIQYPLE
jgi:hypothetical protein